ncbi:MAG: type II secretion system F family protein, partial [Clostridia bacterium]|nr:type II secretion system F family protein [Clostridia bacterium]
RTSTPCTSSTTSRSAANCCWPLTTALNQTGLFPAMVTNLAGIGEETGDLQDMLAKTADYYDEEVDAATQRMLALLEPMVILFMAGFVAIIVFSIFLIVDVRHVAGAQLQGVCEGQAGPQ